jgi:hypothetical protein
MTDADVDGMGGDGIMEDTARQALGLARQNSQPGQASGQDTVENRRLRSSSSSVV